MSSAKQAGEIELAYDLTDSRLLQALEACEKDKLWFGAYDRKTVYNLLDAVNKKATKNPTAIILAVQAFLKEIEQLFNKKK